MALTRYRLYFDNAPADDERLALIEEIRVDQAIDLVAEAQITIPIGRDQDGDWPGVLDEAVAPLARVRIEVQIGEADFVPLIEGRVVAQRFEMGGGPERKPHPCSRRRRSGTTRAPRASSTGRGPCGTA